MSETISTGRKISRIKYTADELALKALAILFKKAREINGDWIPDFNNSSEWKYYPYFEFSGSAFRFSRAYYVATDTDFGARLCFKTRDEAEKFGKENVKLYKQWMDIEVPAK